MGQEALLVSPDQKRMWLPDRPCHTAEELLADNARYRLGLHGPVSSIRVDDLPSTDPHLWICGNSMCPTEVFVQFDQDGRLAVARSGWLQSNPKFTATVTRDGSIVANKGKGAFIECFKTNGRVDGLTMKFGVDRNTIKIDERHDDGTPHLVTVDHGEGKPARVAFDDEGRVSRIEQSEQVWTYEWGDDTITIRNADGSVDATVRLDKYGNLLEWSQHVFEEMPPGETMALRVSYTYDDHGNWTTCTREVKFDHDNDWKPWFSYERSITYFDERKDE